MLMCFAGGLSGRSLFLYMFRWIGAFKLLAAILALAGATFQVDVNQRVLSVIGTGNNRFGRFDDISAHG